MRKREKSLHGYLGQLSWLLGQGVPDPDANFQLRSAIDKAKAAGIPNENIERAIAKGSGQLGQEGDEWEDIRYEGYGPGGVAILIEAMTDNRNRTAADLRAAFTKQSGNLGETGCVSWMFSQKGILTLTNPPDEDTLLESLMTVGADAYDFIKDDDNEHEHWVEIQTEVDELEAIAQQLKNEGLEISDAERRWVPSTTIDIEDPELARQVLKLIDVLEELDDVQSVTANLE